MSHLLFLDNVARESKGVAPAGEDKSCSAAVYRREKSELTFLEENFHVTTAKFDAVGGN